METFLESQVAAADLRLPAVYDNYRQNLIDTCATARQAGAGVVPSTVAVILGGELFYEHVHFDFDGSYLLARCVLDQVCLAAPQLAAARDGGAGCRFSQGRRNRTRARFRTRQSWHRFEPAWTARAG
jgi:hypothetical protein